MRRPFSPGSRTLGVFLLFSASAVAAIASNASGCVGDSATLPPADDARGADGPTSGNDASDTGAPPVDSGVDADAAAPPECDVAKPFGTPTALPVVNGATGSDVHATLTDDELSIYFASSRADNVNYHLMFATRSDRASAFAPPNLVPGLFDVKGESRPAISGDGTTIVFDSFRTLPAPALGAIHLFMATRASAAVSFTTVTPIVGDYLQNGGLTADGAAIYATNLSTGRTVRLQKSGATFGAAGELANITGAPDDADPMSRDDLTLYLQKTTAGATAGRHIWVHTRIATTQPYGATAAELTTVSTAGSDEQPSWLSKDGCRLYITVTTAGKSHIAMAARPK